MVFERAKRNKTITLSEEEATLYMERCLTLETLSKPRRGSNQWIEADYAPSDNNQTLSFIDSIVFGDTFAILPLLPDRFVDLLIVDPPYNLSKDYAGKAFRKMSDNDYTAFTRQWLTASLHTLKPEASLYVCSDWRTSMIVGNIIAELFTVRNRITWQREKGRGAANNWKNGMEDIWFATVSPKNYTFHVEDVKIRRRVMAPYRENGVSKDWVESANGNFRDTHPSNFWDDISIPYWSMAENTDHPAQKPEKLFAKLILGSSNPGDVIFDPFAGSGTSAVTAKKLGRHFLCVERESVYCALAQKRLESADKAPSIQGYTDGVFWERNTLKQQQKQKYTPK